MDEKGNRGSVPPESVPSAERSNRGAGGVRKEDEAVGSDEAEDSRWHRFSTGVPLTVVATMGILLFKLEPKALRLDSDAITHATSFLAVAVMISLFMERALEVFVGVWRNPKLVHFEVELERIGQQLQEPGLTPAAAESLRSKQHWFTVRRLHYKLGTQKRALWASFVAGLMISLAGLRCLAGLVQLQPADGTVIEPFQKFLFHFVDVLLTGGLIAGGSEGLHKIAQVYATMIDTTNKRLRDGATSATAASTLVTSSSSSLTSTATTSATVTPSASPSAPAAQP